MKIKPVRAGWREVVLVCRKCSRKLDGGFGPDRETSLAKALRSAMPGKPRKGRRAALAVIETGCLDVCPKNAVMALRAGAPGRWLAVPRGMPVDAVMAELGLTGEPPAEDR